MGETTGIAWTDHTFNPWWGCARVSPGCEHCYAEAWAKRTGLQVWGQQAGRRFFGDKHWAEPRKWHAAAVKAKVYARVFCSSMADVFEDRPDLVEPRRRLWDLIAETPYLTWQLLTKRPENIAKMLPWAPSVPFPNVWLGTTCEDQKRADERLPHLLSVPAYVRFASYEPALEAVDFSTFQLDWIIVGGESGSKARPFNVGWAMNVSEHCERTGTAFFMKQMGDNPLGFEKSLRGHHGADPSEWPKDLRVQNFPERRP